MSADDEPEYELQMPFVVCQSQGGPYDDDSFTAGYELGALDRGLSQEPRNRPTLISTAVRLASSPQVDLIAMQHGFTCEITPFDDEWATAVFTRSPEP